MRKADAICQRYNEATAALARPHDLPSLARYTDRTLRALDRALADERALRPPQRLEAAKRGWLAQARRIRADTVAVRDAARRGDTAAVRRAILRGTRDDARGNALAQRLGLKICSKP